MRERQPWLWQADAYGTAATLHCLLFGQYMEVERVVPADGGKPYLRLKRAFQRQWACKLWGRLFGVLLNGAGGAAPPDYAALRDEVEAHLTGREEARERRRELVRLVQMVDAAAAARS